MDILRTDAGHARSGGAARQQEVASPGPVIRFPRKDPNPRPYTVWAVKDGGAVICVAALDSCPDAASAVVSATVWRTRPDLGADVTAVVVSGPAGERVPTLGEGV